MKIRRNHQDTHLGHLFNLITRWEWQARSDQTRVKNWNTRTSAKSQHSKKDIKIIYNSIQNYKAEKDEIQREM